MILKLVQVNMMKGVWRKYLFKFQGCLYGYLEDVMLYVLVWMFGMYDNSLRIYSIVM